jgi:hypothetical protein
MKKWQDDQRPDFTTQDGGRDVPILRLGDVYLIAAEAACAAGYGQGHSACTGSQATILTYITPLRLRAANCQVSHGCSAAQEALNKTAIMDGTHMPATIDLEWLMDERGRELYGEYGRWLDLARTGLWHRIVDNNWQASPVNFVPGAAGPGSGAGFFNEAKHHLRPIPQGQIDNTAGGVGAFPQNPGY